MVTKKKEDQTEKQDFDIELFTSLNDNLLDINETALNKIEFIKQKYKLDDYNLPEEENRRFYEFSTNPEGSFNRQNQMIQDMIIALQVLEGSHERLKIEINKLEELEKE